MTKTDTALIANIKKFVEQHSLLQKDSTIIVGLSGGPDSVFLLHFLKSISQEYNIRFVTAHLDHEWRDNSSDDVTFCQSTAKNLNIEFVSEKASNLTVTVKFNGSKEEVGRKLRRYFFSSLQKKYNARAIALGHHAQDQQETFFIRLIRGATLSGLCAMKPQGDAYIRPLLQTNKSDIIAFLDANNIAYLTDPTNISDEYLRNRIRNHVLPALNQTDERFDKHFLKTIANLQETDSFLQSLVENTFNQLAKKENSAWVVSIPDLATTDSFLQNRLIMYWLIQQNVPFVPTTDFIEEIKKFLFKSTAKKHDIHEKWSLIRINRTFSKISQT